MLPMIPPALWGAGAAAGLLALALRLALARRQASHAHTAALGDWRWPRGLPPEDYALRVDKFLHGRGWRVLQAEAATRGRVLLVVQKDNLTVAIRCLGPDQPPRDAQDLREAEESRHITSSRIAAVAAASRRGSRVLHSPQGGMVVQILLRDLGHIEAALAGAV